MKKRIIAAIILVLVLSFSLSALVGCDEIFKKNDERDAKQVVATVTYGNQTASVTKGELTASFNSYAYYYTYYYGLSYQEAADYIVKSLAQRELLVLYAKEYLAGSKGLNLGKAPELCTLKELLTDAEYYKAIEETNADMLTSLASIIDGLVTDDSYNSAADEKTETPEVTDAVKVKFDSQGGSDVATIEIQKGTYATEPTDPTYSGYSFYGWYTDKACTVKYDFSPETDAEKAASAINATTTLYAKWVEYRTPRTVKPEAAEEDDYDPDRTTAITDAEIAENNWYEFFSAEYVAKLKSKDIELATTATIKDADFAGYVDEGITKLKTNLASNYHDYAYYLENEMKTLVITKLERYIGNTTSTDYNDVVAQFDRLVAENKETFGAGTSNTSFESALKSSLATTYFHKVTVDTNNSGYGFVVNILLKLAQEDVDELTALVTDGNQPKAAITAQRDAKLRAMQVYVTNSAYDAEAKIDYNGDAEDVEIVDPMTDPANPYNGVNGNLDTKYQKEGGNNYDKLISFEQVDGKWSVVYGATECPTMPYMIETVPAFDDGTHIGVVNQIYNSFKQVTDAVAAGTLSHVESVYWLREVATAWVYLVGDDTGMTTTDSNNNGLGYLINPDGEDSSYLENFTTLARELIKKGIGTYSVDGTATENNFYTFADSFIESGSTSSAYAGIFVLLCSYKAWDDNAYTKWSTTATANGEELTALPAEEKVTLGADGKLPMNYIVTYGKTVDDCVTVYEQLHSDLETGKRKDAYNLEANTFGVKYAGSITYNEKVYKSLWKDLN